jgi:hypothetical protein
VYYIRRDFFILLQTDGLEQHTQNNQGSIAEQMDEIRQRNLSGNWVAVGKARRMFFWIAVLLFISEMMWMDARSREFDPTTFILALIEASVFIALGIWTKKKPYTAVVTGLIIFIALILFSASLGAQAGPQGLIKSLVSGAIVKFIIFVTLIKAVNDARELQKMQKH